MNVRASPHDFTRIRSTIGAALRVEHDRIADPAPQRHESSKATRDPRARRPARKGLLEIHARDAQREKVFADVDAAVAVLVRAAGREPKIATKPDPSRPGDKRYGDLF
jgi:hypothetical protein